MRRTHVFFLILVAVFCVHENLYAYSGGSGTSSDPFLITTAAELNSIGATPALWASYFKLAANINMSGYTGTSYKIIGNYSQRFTGGFDGNGFVISNLTYTAAVDTDCVGMFGYTDHAVIKNVQLVNVSISSILGEDVGGLIGYQDYGTTTNCSTTGAVSGGTAVGGLVGHYYGASPARIMNCYSTASVYATSSRAGGLVGFALGPINSCYSTGNVTANSGTTSFVGGFIGDGYWAVVSNCYSTGNVAVSASSWDIGGFIGYLHESTLTNCYSTGTVTGGAPFGGFLGYYDDLSTLTACFWDTTSSGTTDGVLSDNPDPAGILGRTTAQMKTTSTFTSYGWDFTTPVWVMHYEGFTYPALAWQPSEYGGGGGTSGNPWKIFTKAQLEYLGSHTDDYDNYFILMADIDLGATTYTQSIIAADTDNVTGGHQGSAFKGDFDGNSHIIRNLIINAPESDYVGLFGWVYGSAKVRNLSMENVNAAGRLAVGGMIGANSGQVTNCHTTGLVSGSSDYTGGLAGWNGSAITGCHSTCEIDGWYYNGGLAGFNSSNGNISNSYTNGTTNGKNCTGGLVGRNEGAVSSCYTLGATQGYCSFLFPSFYSDGYYVGGLVGENLGTITSCYARGEVTRNGNGRIRNVGGLVGWNNQGKVIRSYSTGMPTGYSAVGGLVGAATTGGNYEDTGNFWDTDTSGTTTSAMGTGKTTTQMKTQGTFTGASWDFTTGWAICEAMNYPKLRWQTPTPGNFVCPDEVRMEDLAYMAKRWLQSNCASTSNCDGADLDLSGAVNVTDLLILTDNWLQ